MHDAKLTAHTHTHLHKMLHPLVVAALEAAGSYHMHEYIWRSQKIIVAQVACCPIYELCTEADRRPGTSRMMRWWDQDVVQESEE